MKKLSILLVIALCLSLCACNWGITPAPETALDVHITAGKIEAGMTLKDVAVEVTFNHEPVACQLELVGFDGDGNWLMGEDEVIAEDFYVRLSVYYTLPKGYTLENIQVTMTCDGGRYDCTDIVVENGENLLEVSSTAYYGQEPQPTQEQTEAPSEPQTHEHNWTQVNNGMIFIDCNMERTYTYTCSCGETKTETVPGPGHELGEWGVSPATCTYAGHKSASCRRCGAGFIIEIPATGHNWSAWVKKTGRVHSRTCSLCGAEEEADHNIPSGSVTCTDCGADIIN